MIHGKAAPDDWEQHWSDYAGTTERNPAQRYRFRVIDRWIRGFYSPEDRLLDVGSGQGDLLGHLARRRPAIDAVGVELSRAGVEIASTKVRTARFLQRDLLDGGAPPPELTGWATIATCSEVLEHVDEPQHVLEAALAYMAPGCRLLVTVPGGPRSAFDRYIGHRRHYTRTSLRTLLEASGLIVEEVAAIGFPFFNLYRLLIVLRGDRLIRDVAADVDGAGSRVAHLAMTAFDGLMRADPRFKRLGWQMIASARVPHPA